MNPKMNMLKFTLVCFCWFLGGNTVVAQTDASTLKAQIALGINSPSTDGLVQDFRGKSINFQW